MRKRRAAIGRMNGPIVSFGATIALMYLLVPIVVVVMVSFSTSRYLTFPPAAYSFRWYLAAFEDRSWAAALVLSLEVAVMVALVAGIAGTMGAFGFMRLGPRARRVCFAAALFPIVVPGIVVAVGSYLLFSHLGLLDTRTALVLAHSSLALPVVFLTVVTALRECDPHLEIAARALGASAFESARRITLPLVKRGILAAMVFAFVTSFDEPVVALFIAGTRVTTLPKRMWDGIQYDIDPTSAAVSVMLVAVAAVAVIAGGWAARSGQKRRQPHAPLLDL